MLSIIAAVSKNNVIGKRNELPWYLPADLKRFAEITTGHYVIMGRNTYQSILDRINKPLPNRINIVISNQKDFQAPGCLVVNSLSEAISKSPKEKESFIIGGAQVYKDSIDQVDRLYITHIHSEIEGDVYFPEINKSEWNVVGEKKFSKDERNPFDFTWTIYERKK